MAAANIKMETSRTSVPLQHLIRLSHERGKMDHQVKDDHLNKKFLSSGTLSIIIQPGSAARR